MSRKTLLLTSVLCALLLLPLTAQPMPGGGPMPGPNPQPGAGQIQPPILPSPQLLKEYFNLTDGQMTQVEQVLRNGNAKMREAAEALRVAETKLEEALKAASPDPLTVGNALLAVRAARENLQKARLAMGDAFEAVLNAAQKAQLVELRHLAQSMRLLPMLQTLGLGD